MCWWSVAFVKLEPKSRNRDGCPPGRARVKNIDIHIGNSRLSLKAALPRLPLLPPLPWPPG